MNASKPYQNADLHLAEVGLTSEELDQATHRLDQAELNLSCSDLACHIATNEFELVAFASN